MIYLINQGRNETSMKRKRKGKINNMYYQEIKDEVIKGEKWRDVKEYEDGYIVSNLGRIYSLSRLDSRGRRKKGKIISQRHRKDNYWDFSLFDKDGKEHKVLTHRIVAEAWVDNDNPDFDVIDHIDNDPCNNVASNLRWSDTEGNNNDPVRIERAKDSYQNHKGKQLVCVNRHELVDVQTVAEASDVIGVNPVKVASAIRYGHVVGNGWRVGYMLTTKVITRIEKVGEKLIGYAA